MSIMDQLNTPQRTTVELTAEIPGSDDLHDKIIAEVERLESENLNNITVTGHSLLFNHIRYDSMHQDETIAEFGPEFSTLNAGFSDKTSVDNNNNPPETNQTTMAANFDTQSEKNISTINDRAIQGNSVGLGGKFVATLHQLQRQNSELKDQVMQQDQIISKLRKKKKKLQKKNLELRAHVMQRDEIILELRKQFNALHDIHRLNLQTSTGERLKRQETTEIDQEQKPAAELTDRPQIEIVQVDTTMTNKRSIIIDCSRTNQLQDIESGQSSTDDETETGGDSKEVKQSEHVGPLLHEHNCYRSDGSLQDRSARIRESGGKRIKFNVESIEESSTNARNSRKRNSTDNSTVIPLVEIGRKPYVCKDCGDVFIQNSQLKRHQRTHTDFKKKKVEKTYECKDCGHAFRQSSHLKTHQRKHTGERPYECEECVAAFATSGQLKRHLKTHSDEKPFICDICKESFRLKRELSQHMYAHSGKKSHKCNECQNVFRYISTLRKHLLRNH